MPLEHYPVVFVAVTWSRVDSCRSDGSKSINEAMPSFFQTSCSNVWMDLFQRANWLTGSTRTTDLARTDANTYTENGGIATRTRSEDLLVNTTPFGRQTYETWSYDANNLVERYTRASVVKSQNLATGCYPDALTAPRDDWRYRYAPFMEREQKRQVELSSGEYQLEGLAWVYYGLGGDKKQLSVWNGVQGTWCLQNNHVFLWPVEYNSYGPMNTRIITRAAGGTKEIVFTDHLGSTVQVRRGTPEYGADQRAYTAFGEDVNLPNEALMGRTGYIGRETDNESALGFYGVRQYDAGYGRFLSVDPLWALYPTLTPFHYSMSNPVTQLDGGGKWVQAADIASRETIRSSVPSRFRDAVQFDDNGRVDASLLKAAAQGQDVNSNIAVLARLAENKQGILVHTGADYEYNDENGVAKSGALASYPEGESGPFLDSDNTLKGGITIVPILEGGPPAGIPDQGKRFSKDENIHVYVSPTADRISSTVTKGSIGAHEMFSHAVMYIQTKLKVPGVFGWWHGAPQVDKRAEDAEKDAKQQQQKGSK